MVAFNLVMQSIKCPKCQGTGKKSLSRPYQECVELIRKMGTPTVQELFMEASGRMCRTAINQRVKRMIGWGLIRNVGTQRKMKLRVV